jgi:lipoprotein-anchoring transpeptidase ErfK/SrfK
VHDTWSRYIYIHGTSDEKRIGEPVSAGCVRMKNADVIELFDEVLVNDLVIIR